MTETTNTIINEIGDSLVAVLIDESCDVSIKEQMTIILCYVDKRGYDGASNIQGEFNGLKTLIMKDNEYAIYVHCFAHQLQLTLIVIAKKHNKISVFFNLVSDVVNVVGASSKRRDILREKQVAKIVEPLKNGELSRRLGLNHETKLKRAGDTRWCSHYDTLISLIVMFSSVINVLEIVDKDDSKREQRFEACTLLEST
ncbi:hypothetical protein HHK36_011784 [Tetracentron sinense]|uniref:DUF4371 domain-containing protein n=1 Tax=Tetracentron sinense TaxID=13715 RepID=A0A834ZDM3_TETSI|nr:hypothetical protein HHK36_011784 [Tetracentron sinense]